MAKSFRRRSSAARKRDEDSGPTAQLIRLFDIGPYDRNQVTRAQMDRLRDLVDTIGLPAAAERLGMAERTLLTVCAGFGHRLRPQTAAKIRAFLSGKRES